MTDVQTLTSEARVRKAHRLAAGARERGISADTAAVLDEQGRVALAGLVGVRPPSDITWAMTVELLRSVR